MTPEELHGPEFADLIRQLAALAAEELRAEARAAAPEPPELVVPEPPVFADPQEAAAALREAYPGRGAATRRLAEAAHRSRRTARQWLRATPPGRANQMIAAVTRLLHDIAIAEAEAEHARAARAAADEAAQLLADAEARIDEAGPGLAADGLRDYHSADVGGVDVAYGQTGKKDGKTRHINRVSINFNPIADELPDVDEAVEAFEEQVLDDYDVGLSGILSVHAWPDGITIYHRR
ncbi:hypothetical protein [Amycolatopsis sp. NPDC004079]|uniref:hypothetical protein n=1 Tax=Amycolatopsis sp. NPDC004079 TaxID=3154549 RepID=UPI0033B48A8F